MVGYYIIYKEGVLMETAFKQNWDEKEFIKYANHKYGNCYIKNLEEQNY